MFFDLSTPSMRKVDHGETKKTMLEKVTTNINVSRLPKRQLTGTPTARARIVISLELNIRLSSEQYVNSRLSSIKNKSALTIY